MKVPTAARFAFQRLLLALLTVCVEARVSAQSNDLPETMPPSAGLIIAPDSVTDARVEDWKNEGFDAIVLVLDERFEAAIYRKAVNAIPAASFDVYYWIEVGRNPTFANEHPEWMASLGLHDDWRKRFPEVRQLQDDEVAKAWPWTPIAYRAAFNAHLTRIKSLLGRVPDGYRGLLLNDLQGGPSSCGCGNLQCRWAIDYGVPSTTEKIDGHDVAVRFLSEVSGLAQGKSVIPVWTTECEQEDMAVEKQPDRAWTTEYCGGVDCFNYCRDRFTEQWTALHAAHRGPTAILSLHKEFQRDRAEYGPPGNWVKQVLRYVDQTGPKSVPRRKLWLIVQGFDVTRQDEKLARQAAAETGVDTVLVARTQIEQSYEPRLVKAKPRYASMPFIGPQNAMILRSPVAAASPSAPATSGQSLILPDLPPKCASPHFRRSIARALSSMRR